MPISTEEALSAYGFVYTLANAIPDIKGYLNDAIQNGWTPERLTAVIQSSPWYQQNADTVRNLVTMQATQPATYRMKLANAAEAVQLKAWQLGRQLSPGQAEAIALQTLTTNEAWDDQRLTWRISTQAPLIRGEGGAYTGQAAGLVDHMKQIGQAYGVATTDAFVNQWAMDVGAGINSLDGFDQVIKARAKAAYPQFASQIDAGLTVRDIADPYISTMAKTLELDEANITLDDRYIKKALQQAGQDGVTRTSMPLWQFERTLKDDARYDKTKQAKGDAFSALAQIGRDFGFTGSGSAAQ